MNNKFSNIDKSKLKEAIGSAAENSGINAEKLSSAIESGNAEGILSALSSAQATKLQSLLEDKESLNKILSSPMAAKLIKELTK